MAAAPKLAKHELDALAKPIWTTSSKVELYISKERFEPISKRSRDKKISPNFPDILLDEDSSINRENHVNNVEDAAYDLINVYKRDTIHRDYIRDAIHRYNVEFEERVQKGIEEKINNLSVDEILKMKGEEVGMKSMQDVKTVKAYHILYSFGFVSMAVFTMTLLFDILPVLPSLSGILMSAFVVLGVYRGEKTWLKYFIDNDNTTTNQ